MPSNILNAVSGIAVSVTQSFLFGYFLYAFAVTINPVYQAFEDAFKIPNSKMGRGDLGKGDLGCGGKEGRGTGVGRVLEEI